MRGLLLFFGIWTHLSDVPIQFYDMIPIREEDETHCRGGVLPVGETSRSDSGGGVSAEECSRRNVSFVSLLYIMRSRLISL